MEIELTFIEIESKPAVYSKTVIFEAFGEIKNEPGKVFSGFEIMNK